MNEEEKKAIKYIKKELKDEKKHNPSIYKGLLGLYENNEIETILHLIEKQQKEIEFYKMQELGYIAGYEDGKSHKQTAVAIRNENEQYELIRRHIEKLEDELKDCIHKDKIRKLKELVHKTLDDNGITRGYQLTIDNYFKKLLGE